MKQKRIRVSSICLIAVPAGSQLNDKSVAELAATLKTTPEELQKQLITTETDVTKMTSEVVSKLINGITILSEADKNTLLDNHGKNKYNEGKLAGIEMPLKDAKEKLGLKDSKAKDWDAFLSEYAAKVKTEAGVDEPTSVKALKAEKEALQESLIAEKAEVVKWKGEVENVKTSTIINGELERAVKNIQIDVPQDKENAQREMLTQAFKNQHEVKLEDSKTVIYKEGKKLVDNLQNPLSVADAMKEFAPKYVPIKVAAGRGQGSSDPANQSALNEELGKIKTKEDFLGYLKTKGISEQSEKAQEVYMALRKLNPTFKLT